jgi:hypothetical protein
MVGVRRDQIWNYNKGSRSTKHFFSFGESLLHYGAHPFARFLTERDKGEHFDPTVTESNKGVKYLDLDVRHHSSRGLILQVLTVLILVYFLPFWLVFLTSLLAVNLQVLIPLIISLTNLDHFATPVLQHPACDKPFQAPEQNLGRNHPR